MSTVTFSCRTRATFGVCSGLTLPACCRARRTEEAPAISKRVTWGHRGPRRVILLVIAVALILTLGVPSHSYAASLLTLQALDVLETQYVDPVEPVPLLNAALAGIRRAIHVPADDLPPLPVGTSREAALRLFSHLLEVAATRSGMSIEELDRASVQAMVDSLHDSHTYFLPPSAYEEQEASLYGEPTYTGIGIRTATAGEGERGVLYVAEIFPGSPAAAAGLHRLDVITAVDGHPVNAADADRLPDLIRGAPGSQVTLTVSRGGQVLELPVVRDQITPRPVIAEALTNGVLRIAVVEFTRDTAGAILGEVQRLGGAPAGIILDLRGNPGGLLIEAEYAAGLFVPEGTVLGLEEGRGDRSTVVARGEDVPLRSVPLVILVDRETASAAELLASGLRDAGRARVVGTHTAGALGAAITVPLSEGGLSVTIARLRGARGETIENVGIDPDIQVDVGVADVLAGRDTPAEAAAQMVLTGQHGPGPGPAVRDLRHGRTVP
jgi:carboxyl-terminal processing protease